ncbi:flotillin-like FloA family protein [Staphylococcus aureus]|uniref:flotillin-like FloA family protein n=1 Tax=Staphylococcus aureus TaxID=1280 RepID=UPI0037DA258A
MFSLSFIVIAAIYAWYRTYFILICTHWFMDFSVSSWRSCCVIGTLVGMRLHRVSPRKVIAPLIKAHKAGLALTTNQLESHYLAGGNVDRVVDANIAAQRADINFFPFERACCN